MSEYTGLFSSKYQLTGSDWIKRLDPEDQKVLIHIGLAAGDYGRMGGQARAETAKRDSKGRFASNNREGNNE